MPAPTPLTAPEELTVAMEVLLLLQVPPDVALVKVDDVPIQVVVTPVIVPAEVAGFTVNDVVVNADPQLVTTT